MKKNELKKVNLSPKVVTNLTEGASTSDCTKGNNNSCDTLVECITYFAGTCNTQEADCHDLTYTCGESVTCVKTVSQGVQCCYATNANQTQCCVDQPSIDVCIATEENCNESKLLCPISDDCGDTYNCLNPISEEC